MAWRYWWSNHSEGMLYDVDMPEVYTRRFWPQRTTISSRQSPMMSPWKQGLFFESLFMLQP